MKASILALSFFLSTLASGTAYAEPYDGVPDKAPSKEQVEKRKELKLSNPPRIGPVDKNAPPPVLHVEPPEKKGSNNKWFFILGGLAIAVAFYMTTRDRGRSDDDDDDPPPAAEATAD